MLRHQFRGCALALVTLLVATRAIGTAGPSECVSLRPDDDTACAAAVGANPGRRLTGVFTANPSAAASRWIESTGGLTTQAPPAPSKRGRQGFVARHPKVFGALVGATAGGGAAYAKWGAEGTWVGVWIGAAAGAGIAALISR